MIQLSQLKRNINKHKDKIIQPKKNIKRQTQGPIGLHELFLLTLPIEEVAYWRHETVLIIFNLSKLLTQNRQTSKATDDNCCTISLAY